MDFTLHGDSIATQYRAEVKCNSITIQYCKQNSTVLYSVHLKTDNSVLGLATWIREEWVGQGGGRGGVVNMSRGGQAGYEGGGDGCMGGGGVTGKMMKGVTVDYCEDVYICGYFNEAKISKYRFLSIVAVLQYRKKYQIFKLFETLSVHRQNVPRQNVLGTYGPKDKTS